MNDVMKGIGGAPCRASVIPEDPKQRKTFPIASGLLDYFPDALAVVSNLSHVANEQHNPGQPVHWARGKSTEEADTMMRHFLQRGTLDSDGIRHTAKVAWRALALLQKELEAEKQLTPYKYYKSTGGGLVYRAAGPTDGGEYWEKGWRKSCHQEQPLAECFGVVPISVEEARKAGAKI